MGTEAHGALARGNGSDAVQRLDLRHAEAVRRQTADGEPIDDESHRSGQEEERQTGCADDRRPGALQSASGLLRGATGDARFAADAALPESGGGTGGADEEPHERVAGSVGGGTGLGEGSAASEPRCGRDVCGDPTAIARPATKGSAAGETREPAEEHPRGRRGNVTDVGAGGLRSAAL